MSITFLKQSAAAALLVLGAAASQAAVLFSQQPADGVVGLQTDGSTPALSQTFTGVAPGSMLESIEWFGYHLLVGEVGDGAGGTVNFGPENDLFSININGSDVANGITLVKGVERTVNGVDLYKYTLNIVDILLTSSTGAITIANGDATQWAWQCSTCAFDTAGDPVELGSLFAFTLNGTPAAIPAPPTLALALLSLVALGAVSRGRRPRA